MDIKKPGMLAFTGFFCIQFCSLERKNDRNAGICIVRNRNGITAENLSYILKRNDIKKSDAYQSGFLEGTTPAYEAYMYLKKTSQENQNDWNEHRIRYIGHTIYKKYFCGSKTKLLP